MLEDKFQKKVVNNMNAKIIVSGLCALTLCSCKSFIEAYEEDASRAYTLEDHVICGIAGVFIDVFDVCVGDTAPRKDELKNKKIVFLGTLEEGGNVYQIRDVVSFQQGRVIRMNGGIDRMNKAPEVRKRGVLPAYSYESIAMSSLSCYERTGGASAIFKKNKSSKEGEKYTLTYASSEAGTYTYENIENGVLIGKGEGVFDVENLD